MNEVAAFADKALAAIIAVSAVAAVLFLVRGGYLYITSSGKPDALEEAKKTIRNALVGLVIVLSAAVFSSLLSNAANNTVPGTPSAEITLSPIEPAEPTGGLTQVLLDAIAGFLQNIVQSATKPLIDGLIGFLTTTPSLATNSVIFNFWLVILGIADTLFVVVIALLGFQLMSASTFGFEEIEFKHLLPRVGLAFLLANTSIFLADWIILSANALTAGVLASTGGMSQAWVLTAFDPASLATLTTPLITLAFMLLFVILAVVLLLFYIGRLIVISVGAVLSPLIFLIWALPRFADFADIAVKSYIVTVYTVFVHVVIIQLASAFLAVPGQQGTNSLISVLVGVGLFFTLIKTHAGLLQMAFYTANSGALKKVGAQVMNVISTTAVKATRTEEGKILKKRRRIT